MLNCVVLHMWLVTGGARHRHAHLRYAARQRAGRRRPIRRDPEPCWMFVPPAAGIAIACDFPVRQPYTKGTSAFLDFQLTKVRTVETSFDLLDFAAAAPDARESHDPLLDFNGQAPDGAYTPAEVLHLLCQTPADCHLAMSTVRRATLPPSLLLARSRSCNFDPQEI